MSVCIGICGYIILTLYRQYKVSPIVVTFSTKSKLIETIPFPAVTICPESLADSRKFDFQKLENQILNDNYTADDMKFYDYARQVCYSASMSTLKNVSAIENATDFYKTLYNVKLILFIVFA